VFLHAPAWLFLDDATAEVSERMERRIYELLGERMPRSAVVSISHRASVAGYHGRQWQLSPSQGAARRSIAGREMRRCGGR
jgi:putative ATP-binding cassette transporter